MPLRGSALITAGCCVALALAGCSSGTTIGPASQPESSKPAPTIFSDAIAAMKTAKTVHLKGPITGIVFDADLGNGNFSGSASAGNSRFDIVYLSGPGGDTSKARIYLRATPAVWTGISSPAFGACVGGGWLQLDPATAGNTADTPQGAAQLAADARLLGNLSALADALGSSPGTWSKGSVSSVNGLNAVQLNSASVGGVFVATDGPPYVLRISGTSGGQTANLDFTKWNDGAQFSAPAGSRTLVTVLAGCPGVEATPPSPSPSPSASPTP